MNTKINTLFKMSKGFYLFCIALLIFAIIAFSVLSGLRYIESKSVENDTAFVYNIAGYLEYTPNDHLLFDRHHNTLTYDNISLLFRTSLKREEIQKIIYNIPMKLTDIASRRSDNAFIQESGDERLKLVRDISASVSDTYYYKDPFVTSWSLNNGHKYITIRYAEHYLEHDVWVWKEQKLFGNIIEIILMRRYNK